jgi:tRNA A-37 threonylcarbamoyl transferase component Bud32
VTPTPEISPRASAPPPEAAEIARHFPQLEIVELFAVGGMGVVYKARQPRLDRQVALKILSPELSSDPTFAERFAREAQALARLNHSNIVGIYDFGQTGGYYYFLMEFVDGVSLYDLIKGREVTTEETKRIVVEICHALQYAHDEGIVHRDIKPSNILIDKKGRVKIADFGLAKLLHKDADLGMGVGAQSTVVMGTPNYMAPEQLEKPLEVDHRADLYSVGVVFYEMLTHELPLGRFEAPSRKVKTDARLDRVVLRALEKEPSRRFQSATQIRLAVETLADRPAPALSEEERAARSARWGWLWQLGLMTGSAVLAVALYLVLRGHPHGPPPMRSGEIPPGAIAALQEGNGPPGGGGGPGFGQEGRTPAMRLFKDLQLTPEQTLEVNKLVRHSEGEFGRLERRHTERTKDANGHVHVTISPFPVGMRNLLNEVWTNLSATLDSNQLAKARSIRLDRLFPHSGTNMVQVEVWQDTNGNYHFAEEEKGGGKNAETQPPPMSMPSRYRSFLDDRPPNP